MANPNIVVVLGVHCAGCAQFITVMPESPRPEKDPFDDAPRVPVKCHRCNYEKPYGRRDLVERDLPRSLPRR